MWLSRLSIRRPVFATMVVGVMMILGVIGLTRLPVDVFPDVSMPVLTVVVPYPGAAPTQVEREILEPLEDALAGLEGLDELHGRARENVGIVVALFDMGTPMAAVSAELRDRVYGLRAQLPESIRDPMIRRFDPSATPVMTLAVASPEDEVRTRQFAEENLAHRFERLEGVGAVEVVGGAEPEIRVELDLARMADLRIPLHQVAELVGYDSLDIPGGHIEVGASRMGLRSRGQVESLEELGSIVVRGYPQPVRLRDIAEIRRTRAERTTLARVDGERAVTLDVVKESGANTVAVCDRVVSLARSLELPAGFSVEPVMDTSDMARDMLHEMQRALIIGAIMAVLVVYLFMVDWRSTFISALALPTSVVTTFFFMWVLGFSLNMLTLIAMALAIGVLIDDAVVVREVIYRHLEAGEDPVTASLRGTAEVALAVLATTLSILAVFVPVGFMQGLVGQFFAEFGLTVAIAVSVSLFIAFTLDPMLSSRISRVVRLEDRSPVARGLVAFWTRVDGAYRDLLGWALAHGRRVIAMAVALFLASLAMLAVSGSEFIPDYDRARFEIDVDLPPALTLEEGERMAVRVEELLREVPEVRHIYTVVGPDDNPDRILLRVLTTPKGERERSIYDIQDQVRARLGRIPGATIGVRDPPLLEGARMGSDIEVAIRGNDLADLREAADAVRMGMSRIEGAVNVRTTRRAGRPELQLEVDRDRAGMAGLSVGQAGITLRMATAGQVVGSLREGDERVDIRLKARESDLTPRRLMSRLLLLSPLPRVDDPHGQGTPVALGNVGRLIYETAPTTIHRFDRERYLEVSCALAGRALSDVVEDTERMLGELTLPPGVDVAVKGMAEVAGEALLELLFALGLSIVFVYAVLASQFDSFIHPFTIMLSLPLAVVGAFATVFLVGWPIGITTMLGIILLMGLVTKNAILLVDRANQLRQEGASVREAMLEAGHLRLRPILMTSLAMILGMLPPAVLQGSGSEIFQPMALPVIGGLVASTLLTLVVVPVVYTWLEELRERGRR